jgi:hypothetical protein
VNGETGVSGLKFYFWTQSFGRITGGSQWGTKFDNGAGPFFFTHTFLWAFFPWCLLVIGGLIKSFDTLIREKFSKNALPEFLTTGGFILIFVSLSASKYKLPHYIFVTLPFASVIASNYLLREIFDPAKRVLRNSLAIFHIIFFSAIAFLISVFLFVFFPGAPLWKICIAYAGIIFGIYFAVKEKGSFKKIVYPLLCGLLSLFFVADFHFYPRLLKYESTAVAGKMIAAKKIPADDVYAYHDVTQFAIHYYSGEKITNTYLDSVDLKNKIKKYGKLYFYTDKEGYEEIKKTPMNISDVTKLEDYSIQFLTLNFLRPSTRNSVLRERYFLEVNDWK